MLVVLSSVHIRVLVPCPSSHVGAIEHLPLILLHLLGCLACFQLPAVGRAARPSGQCWASTVGKALLDIMLRLLPEACRVHNMLRRITFAESTTCNAPEQNTRPSCAVTPECSTRSSSLDCRRCQWHQPSPCVFRTQQLDARGRAARSMPRHNARHLLLQAPVRAVAPERAVHLHAAAGHFIPHPPESHQASPARCTVKPEASMPISQHL